jgi:flagellar protein FlaG
MSIENINSINSASYQSNAASSVRPSTDTVSKSTDTPEVAEKSNLRAVEITDNQRNNDTEVNDSKAAEAIKKAVDEINKQNANKTVQFGIHERTGRMTIKILNKDTKEVIKEFPAEKTLDLIAKAWEMAGIMVDEKR